MIKETTSAILEFQEKAQIKIIQFVKNKIFTTCYIKWKHQNLNLEIKVKTHANLIFKCFTKLFFNVPQKLRCKVLKKKKRK